jgi:hypothetical protein
MALPPDHKAHVLLDFDEMDEEIELLRLEIARAEKRYPQDMDIVRFIGAANLKVSSIQAKLHHHAIRQSRGEELNSRLAILQLAAICMRCLNHLGGIDRLVYDQYVKQTSGGYKFQDHAKS